VKQFFVVSPLIPGLQSAKSNVPWRRWCKTTRNVLFNRLFPRSLHCKPQLKKSSLRKSLRTTEVGFLQGRQILFLSPNPATLCRPRWEHFSWGVSPLSGASIHRGLERRDPDSGNNLGYGPNSGGQVTGNLSGRQRFKFQHRYIWGVLGLQNWYQGVKNLRISITYSSVICFRHNLSIRVNKSNHCVGLRCLHCTFILLTCCISSACFRS